jgi:hypothetical protein
MNKCSKEAVEDEAFPPSSLAIAKIENNCNYFRLTTSRKKAFHPNPLVPKYFDPGLMGL